MDKLQDMGFIPWVQSQSDYQKFDIQCLVFNKSHSNYSTIRSLSICPFWPANWPVQMERFEACTLFPATTIQIPALWKTEAGELSGSSPLAGSFWLIHSCVPFNNWLFGPDNWKRPMTAVFRMLSGWKCVTWTDHKELEEPVHTSDTTTEAQERKELKEKTKECRAYYEEEQGRVSEINSEINGYSPVSAIV